MTTMFPTGSEVHYWKLTLKDGRSIDIPPQAVELVKAKMTKREPIHTSQESIPFAEIVSFERSSKRIGSAQKQLQIEAAQAFGDPIVTDAGEVKARWVKKEVSRAEYDRKYAKHSNYRYLSESDGMVSVAFVLPLHMFDKTYMEYCTIDEERKLEGLTKH